MRWLAVPILAALVSLVACAEQDRKMTEQSSTSNSANMAETAVTPSAGDITVTETRALAETGDVTLIDVRRAREWKSTGMAEGAIGITLQDKDFVEQVIAAVGGDKSQPIALICRSGNRSGRAQKQLLAAGFTRVQNVTGGTLAWKKQGLPVDECQRC